MFVKIKYLLICCTFCFVSTDIIARETDDNSYLPWMIGGRVHAGFLLNHHNNMRILNEQDPYAVEISIAKATSGEKAWQSFYHFPQYGISYMVLRSGSPSYLGKAHCIYPFFHFFLTPAERFISLDMRLGAGIAYVEKIFNRIDNYKNTAISSHFNAFLSLQMEGRVRIISSLYLSGGLAFMHISNGAYRKPNSGLNYVTAFTGVNYAFGKERTVEIEKYTDSEINKKWHYTLYFSGGIKTSSAFDGTKYIASGLSLEASKSHLLFTRFSGTLDVFYDASDYAYLIKDEVKVSKAQTVKTGFAAGYSFLFGSLSANVQAGMYLYAKNRESGSTYQRLALRYAITDHLNAHFGLKTHLGKADYIEVAFGYRLK